jgi:L-threonylcarbamoyladenylate synthase
MDTVGIRAPRHAVALALIRAVGEPIAAPSANAHTHVSPTTAEHVVRSLGERVDLVLDAGACVHGIESTVLALGDPPRVLRPGAVSLEQLRAIEPAVAYEAVNLEESQKMQKWIEAAGGQCKLTIYPGVGHNSWDNAYRNEDLGAWLLQHKK